MSYFQI